MNPDYEIEEFWLGLKNSMNNFYLQISKSENIVEQWSSQLNELQRERNYAEIEISIHRFITKYAIDILRSMNLYHYHILYTNIKRWRKLREKYRFFKSRLKYENIVYLYIDIMNTCYKYLDLKSCPSSSQVQVQVSSLENNNNNNNNNNKLIRSFFHNIGYPTKSIIDYNTINTEVEVNPDNYEFDNSSIYSIIQLALDTGLYSILDKLMNYTNIHPYIYSKYGISLPIHSKIKGKKVFDMILKLNK
jgi:hypothetical protein